MNTPDRTRGTDRGRQHEGTRMRAMGFLLAWMAAIGLVACGGGGEMVARIGSGGSGAPVTVGVGTVGGFGSLVINGQHFDETAAQFRIDERPDQPTDASVDSIRLGMQIQFEHQSNRISQATVAAEVIGPVTSVSATGLLVLGQTVLVNADPAAPTVFDGISALSELTPGAMVEVHGQRNTAGEILATRIEQRPAGSVLRVAGTVGNLANGVFRVGALTIRATQAAIVPAGQSLANGQRIAAWTDLALVNGELVARVVRIGGFVVPNNAALTIDGVITDYQNAASLRIGGIAVDASSAQFVGGAIADLRNGRSVRASGTVGSNVLRATRIEFLSVSAAAQIELSGALTAFVDAGTAFRIRNAAARVTPQTTYVRGDASNLGEGVLVKAEGPMVNGVVEVARLEFQPPSASIARVLFGTIAAPVTVANDGTRTFRVTSLPFDFKTTTTTRFRKGVVTDIAVGRSVKVNGNYDGLSFIADDVQFMDNAQDPPTVCDRRHREQRAADVGGRQRLHGDADDDDGLPQELGPGRLCGPAERRQCLDRSRQAQRPAHCEHCRDQGTGRRHSVGARTGQWPGVIDIARIPGRLAACQRCRQSADHSGQPHAGGHPQRHRPRSRRHDCRRPADRDPGEVPLGRRSWSRPAARVARALRRIAETARCFPDARGRARHRPACAGRCTARATSGRHPRALPGHA